MSQDDLSVANASGATVRADINSNLQALGSLMAGTSAPGTTYAYQLWADTTNNVLKRRNAANSAWIVERTLSESFILSRSSNTILALADKGKTIVATSTFTQTFTAAATLGDGWEIEYINAGSGTITLDPNGSETIDGVTTITLAPGQSCCIKCNGTAFYTVGLSFAPYASTLTKAIWIPATQLKPTANSGCAALATVNQGVNKPDLHTLDFDPSSNEYCEAVISLPNGWNNGTVTAVFYWSHPATATNFDVVWRLAGYAFGNADNQNASYAAEVGVTDTGGNTGYLYVSPATSALTIDGTPADADQITFRFGRQATNGSDTLAVDARLHGVKLFYAINTLSDA